MLIKTSSLPLFPDKSAKPFKASRMNLAAAQSHCSTHLACGLHLWMSQVGKKMELLRPVGSIHLEVNYDQSEIFKIKDTSGEWSGGCLLSRE